ncbi:MAG: adenosylcobinamide-GDP ribazoletransferase, partial [Nitrospirae bacterium]
SGHPDALVAFPMAGAWAMVVAMFYGRAAKGEGLGYIFVTHTKARQFLVATLTAVLAVLFFASVFRGWASLLVCLLMTLGMDVYFTRRFGGLTGDTLGAVAEINEIVFLMFYLL